MCGLYSRPEMKSPLQKRNLIWSFGGGTFKTIHTIGAPWRYRRRLPPPPLQPYSERITFTGPFNFRVSFLFRWKSTFLIWLVRDCNWSNKQETWHENWPMDTPFLIPGRLIYPVWLSKFCFFIVNECINLLVLRIKVI